MQNIQNLNDVIMSKDIKPIRVSTNEEYDGTTSSDRQVGRYGV